MTTWLFVKQFVQTNNKEIIKVPYCWLFVRAIHCWQCGFPTSKTINAESISLPFCNKSIIQITHYLNLHKFVHYGTYAYLHEFIIDLRINVKPFDYIPFPRLNIAPFQPIDSLHLFWFHTIGTSSSIPQLQYFEWSLRNMPSRNGPSILQCSVSSDLQIGQLFAL